MKFSADISQASTLPSHPSEELAHSIVIADGNQWYIERLKPILGDLFPEIEWTVVSTAEDLIRICRDHAPEMLIIDFSIDGMGLIDVVRILRKRSFNGKIAVTSFYEGSIYAEFAIDAGANIFFDKAMLFEFLQKEFEDRSVGETVH